MSTPHPLVVHIVDDDAGVRDSLEILLRLHGYRAVGYASGEAFLETLDGSPARPGGVVLLDLRLPGMSGAQVHAELAARKLAWPVVILTAHGDVASARNALKAGASDFLLKPWRNARLVEALRAAVAFTARQREGEAMSLEEIERHAIARALDRHDGNVSRAASALGLTRPALYRRIEKHGL